MWMGIELRRVFNHQTANFIHSSFHLIRLLWCGSFAPSWRHSVVTAAAAVPTHVLYYTLGWAHVSPAEHDNRPPTPFLHIHLLVLK